MNKNDKDLEKFKRVKAIIDGTAKPFIPSSSKSTKSTKSVGKKSGSSAMKKSSFKKSTTTTNKKSKQQVESDEDEDEDLDNNYGINDEDDDDNQGLNKLPNKFEDEEIEEEDAFDDDDDDLTKSSKSKNYDADFEGEDFIDLDELLDDDNSSVSTVVSKDQEKEQEEEGEEEDDNSDSSLFSENEFSEPEEEDDNNQEDQNTDNSNLMSIVKGLDKSKRTIRSTSKLPDMTEKVGMESQYNLFPNADENGTIDINDLMSFIPNEFGDVVDQLEAISNKTAISAPVSKYERDTIQRRITTEQAHRILTQWVPFVREQREKNLKFESKVTIDNTAQSVASSFGKTSLNKEISSVLLESGVTESKQKPSSSSANATIKNIITGEDGKTVVAVVDPVEEKRRLREIIKLRSIMYYQEIKDKRKKKIKSKKFRKIEKKKREKDLEKREEELMKLDPEFAKHKAEKLEERRVLERMTQRHKNNSKFMKNMLNNRGLSTDDRRDINEHNKLGKELLLLNKMNNSTVNQDDSDDEGDGDDGSDNDDNETTTTTGKIDLTDVDQKSLSDKERIQMKLQKLGRPTNLPEKGINAMKFMQKSMEKELDDAIKDRNGIDDFEQAELDDAERESQDSNRIVLHKQVGSNKQSSNKIMNSGILVEKAGFGNGHKVVSNLIQVGTNTENKSTPTTPKTTRVEFEEEELNEDNPWLEATKSKKKSKKDKKKQSDEFLISLNNLNSGGNNGNNNNKNNNGAKEKVNNNEISNIDTTTTNKKQNQRKFESKGPSIAGVDTTVDEKKQSKKQFVGMSLITSNKQKDLLLEAFAKDNIEDEFIEEKKQIIQDEVPEEKSNFLPGWGGWVGDGVVQRDNSKREALLKRKREEKIKEQQKKRMDAHNNRVIIDEKAPLEGVSKYVLNKLPQHYSNKDQYESTLSIAHGKDWNSTTAFRKLIEPKVSVSPGTFIKPVSIKDKQDFITKKKEESKKQKKI